MAAFQRNQFKRNSNNERLITSSLYLLIAVRVEGFGKFHNVNSTLLVTEAIL